MTRTTRTTRTIFAALLLVPNLGFAASLSYVTQDRSVRAQAIWAFPDPFVYWSPGPATVAPDFATFDETQGSVTVNPDYDASGSGATARHFSTLADEAITVDLYASATNTDDMSGQAEALSIFDVSFTLAETTSFFVTGWLSSDPTTGPKSTFLIADVLLEDAGGNEIGLDWVTNWESGTVFDRDLDSKVTLAAGAYRLRVEAATDVRCYEWPNACGDYGSKNTLNAEFNMSVVPLPPALVLFPSALAMLGWLRRRR